MVNYIYLTIIDCIYGVDVQNLLSAFFFLKYKENLVLGAERKFHLSDIEELSIRCTFILFTYNIKNMLLHFFECILHYYEVQNYNKQLGILHHLIQK